MSALDALGSGITARQIMPRKIAYQWENWADSGQPPRIYIEAETDPRPYAERIGRDERFARVYNIDYGRCIFCGYCVEACPKDAITHGYNFEISVYNRADLLKTKDDLLITKQKQSKNYRVALSTEDVDSEYKEV